MTKEKVKSMAYNSLFFIVVIGLLYLNNHLSQERGYKKGYELGVQVGVEVGINKALDTIQEIIDKQMDNDTLVSKINFIKKKDTTVYNLSTKTLLNED